MGRIISSAVFACCLYILGDWTLSFTFERFRSAFKDLELSLFGVVFLDVFWCDVILWDVIALDVIALDVNVFGVILFGVTITFSMTLAERTTDNNTTVRSEILDRLPQFGHFWRFSE